MFAERQNEVKGFILNIHPKFKDSPLSADSLLDAIIALHEDCKSFAAADKNGPIPKFVSRCMLQQYLVEPFFINSQL